MSKYSTLLEVGVQSITKTFQKRVAEGMQHDKDFVVPNEHEQARGMSDFELVTWIIIKSGSTT